MLDFLGDRLNSWLTVEPILGTLMALTALIIFIQSYNSRKEKSTGKAWDWIRAILESLGRALLFLGLLWAFRAILNDNYIRFTRTHGRISENNYISVQNIWGGGHVQRELSVYHYITVTRREEIPREDPSKPPLYREYQVEEVVEQNSIQSFTGQADLKLNMRKKGSAFYAGFESAFTAVYEIINGHNESTKAHFIFPLSENQAMYDKLMITEQGKDISDKLRFQEGHIRWDRKMAPYEQILVKISYLSRGLDYFYYQIPRQREIKNFAFTLTVDKLPASEVNYPEGCLPPTEPVGATEDGDGVVLAWKLDKAVTTAGMGIALPSPEQPGVLETQVLKNSAYSLMFLIIAISLTLLILGVPIRFTELALTGAMYSLLFVTIASLTDFFPAYAGFWLTLVAGAALSITLLVFLFRKYPFPTFVRLLVLTGFFTMIYPLLNLVPDIDNFLNGVVFIGLVVYVFTLVHLENTEKKLEKAGKSSRAGVRN